MKIIQASKTVIERQIKIGRLHRLSRRAFLFLCVAALSVVVTGCLLYTVGAVATTKTSVDPQFSATHDLDFKQISTKAKAVILFDTKGRFGGFPKGPFRNAFLEAVKNSGAFSEVVEVSNERDLQKYPDWDVIRIQLDWLELKLKNLSTYWERYQVAIRFEFKATGGSDQFVYPSTLWHVENGANIPTDEAHPLTGSYDQTAGLFAREIVMAALSEAQRSGRYFQ